MNRLFGKRRTPKSIQLIHDRGGFLRNSLYLLVRIIISTALMWYVLSKVDFHAIYPSFLKVNPLWLILAFSSNILGKFISGYRWQVLLAAQDVRIPLKKLISSLFVGGFFNNLLPTTVGGDAVRAYDIAVYSGKTLRSNVATVIAERVSGVLALSLLGMLALVFGFWKGADVSSYAVSILGILILSLLALITLCTSEIVPIVVRILHWLGFTRFGDELTMGFETFQVLKDKRLALMVVFTLSLFLQINVMLHYYLISLSMNLSISPLYFFIIIPIALVVLLTPISINGIGLRENIYVILLSGLGVLATDAVALSWLAFGLLILQGVVGGIILALGGMKIKRPTDKPISTLKKEGI